MSVDFKAKQLEFTAYIRDPEKNPVPADVKKPRMEMYRELIFNNIDSFLADNFPVLKRLLTAPEWQALAQDFFLNHKSKTPYFAEIAEEFLDYLENERNHPKDFPFMLELAHYEWVEMALSIAKEDVQVGQQATDNLLKKNIQLSPLAWPLAYQYPVQRIAPEFLPDQPPEQPTFLLVHRDRNYHVNFIEITPSTFQLLQLIQENGNLPTETYLQQVAAASNHANSEIIITGGLDILKNLAEKSIILITE
jgi:uncharacterized protein